MHVLRWEPQLRIHPQLPRLPPGAEPPHLLPERLDRIQPRRAQSREPASVPAAGVPLRRDHLISLAQIVSARNDAGSRSVTALP